MGLAKKEMQKKKKKKENTGQESGCRTWK